jgi:hypothetical protein
MELRRLLGDLAVSVEWNAVDVQLLNRRERHRLLERPSKWLREHKAVFEGSNQSRHTAAKSFGLSQRGLRTHFCIRIIQR